ncbi:MAG: hypothetical protein GX640_05640 [Fibrobacter sp.]|mgnify:CR=1 FL=1|nr:hypothetical protein [Fibrobacter sp.]
MCNDHFEYCDEPWSGKVAGAIGKGLIAGIIGTVAITISQQIEMNKTGRQPSTTPLQAAQLLLKFKPESDDAIQGLNNLVHFSYGTALGLIRSILKILGIGGLFATILHIGSVQALAMILLPKMKLAPPVNQWDKKTIQIGLIHHTVYGVVAGILFDWMSRCVKRKF